MYWPNFSVCLSQLQELMLPKNLQFLRGHGIRVRVRGMITMLPVRVRRQIEEIEKLTCDYYTLRTLTVLMAYSSDREMQHARQKAKGVTEFQDTLWVKSDVDLIIRTSSEVRLSDFLCFQTGEKTLIFFLRKFWPELTVWDLLLCLFKFVLFRNFDR